ncbi:MAG: hypothetical protein FRX49_00465 [Trebouxia sp. A1-2]|nr:MAG: hypothetical protein FRX49_00465 [Trebouxia sp. A1-2]
MASNPRKGQAKRSGAKTTSHDGKAGHVMTEVCHCVRQEEGVDIPVDIARQGVLHSDSSEADLASDNPVADSPSMPTTATATMAAPRRSGRQHKPAAEYWKVPPSASEGAQ